MCGIIGCIDFSNDGNRGVAPLIVDGLSCLQHRGQDAVGVATFDHDNQMHFRRKKGMVREGFSEKSHVTELKGKCGIGHVRYPTSGNNVSKEYQPFYVNSPYGLLIAHNGNLSNAEQLKRELFENDKRHLNSHSDSEALLNVFAHALQTTDDFELAVKEVYERCDGAFSVVIMIIGVGIVAFRDKNGIRPLIYGHKKNDDGSNTWMVASESVALTSMGFTVSKDFKPGEAIFFDQRSNKISHYYHYDRNPLTPCVFEYVYLARPDSLIDQVSVYRTRLRMGKMLGEKIQREWGDKDIDVVIPVPDTSLPTALATAEHLGVKYREGLVKNRYVGRTFIMCDQDTRQQSIRRKLNILDFEFRGKNVLLVDDSIVRGNTSLQLVNLARSAGANKVYFASAAPEIKYQNVYGIDMPNRKQLIYNKANDESRTISEMINADDVIFQDLDDLKTSILLGPNCEFDDLECSVFDGQYVTGVDPATLSYVESTRSGG